MITRQQRRIICVKTLITLGIIVLIGCSQEVFAQWTTNGNNINNTNTGNVGVGTTNPAQKLDVAGTGAFSGTVTGSALNSYVANSSNAVITPSGSPAIGFNAQRFDQYVSRSAIGGIFAQYIWPDSASSFYSYGVWARAQSLTGGASTVSETIGVLSDSLSSRAVYNAAIKANAVMFADYHVNGAVYGVDASAGPAAGVTLTQGNSIYGVRSIASGRTYGAGDTVYGVYASGSGGSTNWGVYSAAGTNYFNGNVGLGTTTPSTKLHVVGDVTVSGNIAAKYQDVAEWVPATRALPPGTVVTLNRTQSNLVEASSKAYDTRVAGVISEQPGLTLGEKGENKVLVATTGRVRIKVDATNAPIEIGDLLVTSKKEGVAMKSMPVNVGGVEIHRPGTLIGKALEPLATGQGEILVLLSLQ